MSVSRERDFNHEAIDECQCFVYDHSEADRQSIYATGDPQAFISGFYQYIVNAPAKSYANLTK